MSPTDFLALPIHPAVVHFPVATFSLAWGMIVVGHALGDGRLQSLASILEWIGVAFLPLTIAAGLWDAGGIEFLVDRHWDQPLVWHFLASSSAGAVFTGHAAWRQFAGRGSGRSVVIDIGLPSLGFWLLVMTGLIAGEMVFG